MTAARKKKLTAKNKEILRAAMRRGVVPGGIEGTFNQVYRLIDWGLLESSKENTRVYVPTEKGKEALKQGFFTKAKVTKMAKTKTKKQAKAASNSENVNFLKKAGILPPGESASSYPELRGNQQWQDLHRHPTVKARKEIIAEMIKSGKPKLANAVARGE